MDQKMKPREQLNYSSHTTGSTFSNFPLHSTPAPSAPQDSSTLGTNLQGHSWEGNVCPPTPRQGCLEYLGHNPLTFCSYMNFGSTVVTL